MLAIEIHDAGLVVAGATGTTASPACAVGAPSGLELGTRAVAKARTNPRRTVEDFWERLDREPLPAALGAARTRADLAYFHLAQTWKEASGGEAEAILVLPSSFDRAQRSLVVGIAQAAGIPLAGVVESAVAAAASIAETRPRFVVEAGLHRVTGTRIDVRDGALALAESRTIAAHGLVDLLDAWVAILAERFVRDARFDPLHDAATEQALHDHVPGWLSRLLVQPVASLELVVGARRDRIELAREVLVEAARPIYRRLAEVVPAGAAVLVDAKLAALPGALEALRGRGLEVGAAGRAALAHVGVVRSDPKAPAFVTRLPGAAPDAAFVPPVESTDVPTHVLAGWRAVAIDSPLLLGAGDPRRLEPGETANGPVLRRAGGAVVVDIPDSTLVLVNDRRRTGEVVLGVGDALRVGDRELRLVLVAEG